MVANRNELLNRLELIIYSYIENESFAKELIKHIESLKIKYVLAELDKNKNREYSVEDIELIKDIYFHYC